MSVTTITLRAADKDAINEDADSLGQNLIDFVPAMHRLWRETPERKRMEAIKATHAAKRSSADRDQPGQSSEQ